MKKILVTGGTGYIGSHTLVELIQNSYCPIVVDNLHNSSKVSLDRVEKITGKKVDFYEGDIKDKKFLLNVIRKQPDITSVIHFAALKAVGESNQLPLDYYQNNVAGTLTLLEVLKETNIKTFVFSSSATVYGDPESVPITEDFPTKATNPYGQTKLTVELILEDLYRADKEWSISILRYFNPVGAHESGLIGESPSGIPNNLMPYVQQVAIGKRKELSVYGNDYNTPDGTGIRDYIHVVDLAKGHVKALQHLDSKNVFSINNLGTGKGYSVLDIIDTFQEQTGIKIPYKITDRRPGDIAKCWASTTKAEKELGWTAKLGLKEMVKSAWTWQMKNPNGFE